MNLWGDALLDQFYIDGRFPFYGHFFIFILAFPIIVISRNISLRISKISIAELIGLAWIFTFNFTRNTFLRILRNSISYKQDD